jgi:hypothetical protein
VAQQAYLTAFQTKDRHRRVTLSEQGLTRFEMTKMLVGIQPMACVGVHFSTSHMIEII